MHICFYHSSLYCLLLLILLVSWPIRLFCIAYLLASYQSYYGYVLVTGVHTWKKLTQNDLVWNGWLLQWSIQMFPLFCLWLAVRHVKLKINVSPTTLVQNMTRTVVKMSFLVAFIYTISIAYPCVMNPQHAFLNIKQSPIPTQNRMDPT